MSDQATTNQSGVRPPPRKKFTAAQLRSIKSRAAWLLYQDGRIPRPSVSIDPGEVAPPLPKERPPRQPEPEAVLWVIGTERDHPGKLVVRRWVLDDYEDAVQDKSPAAVADTLELARAALPPGCTQVKVPARGDGTVVEVWR